MPEEDFHLPDHVRFQAHEGHASAWPFPRMDGRDRARPSNDAPGTDAVKRVPPRRSRPDVAKRILEGHASAWPFPCMDGRDRARPSNDAPGTDAVPARRDKFHASRQGAAARMQIA